MSNLLIYKDFKADLRFDQTKGSVVVKIIGIPGMFYAKNQARAEEEFHRIVDKELIGQVGEDAKKLLKKTYSGNIAIRASAELHQELTIAAGRKGVSLNSYIEKNLQAIIDQEALGNTNEELKPVVEMSIPLAVRELIEEDKAVELFSKIEPYLDKEKINIFKFPSILRRFLIDFGSAIDGIRPYLRVGRIHEFVQIVLSLIKETGDTSGNGDDDTDSTHSCET
jgi:predicted HicB family RNase H-like nuclease